MKWIKKISLLFFVVIITVILFRAPIYRYFVTYKSIGQRHNYSISNEKLIQYIENNMDLDENANVIQIIKQSLILSSNHLKFTSDKCDVNPNLLINSKNTHCVGYAAFYASTCNFLLEKVKLNKHWKATPHKGLLNAFGYNVHDYFKSSFFKDHDFVVIENKNTGEKLAVDPSLHDYLNIDFVSLDH